MDKLGSVIEEYPNTALAAALDVNDSESIQLAAEETSAASGFYAASKAALVLLSEGLRAEVEPLGIRVIAVEWDRSVHIFMILL